jgi:hypothetical protein
MGWPNSYRSAQQRGPVVSPQFHKQGVGILQIRRVKPLDKPLVHRRQQIVSGPALTLLLPQPRQAGGSAEFPDPDLLTAGDVEGLIETRFCLGRIRERLQEQYPLGTVERLRPACAPEAGAAP